MKFIKDKIDCFVSVGTVNWEMPDKPNLKEVEVYVNQVELMAFCLPDKKERDMLMEITERLKSKEAKFEVVKGNNQQVGYFIKGGTIGFYEYEQSKAKRPKRTGTKSISFYINVPTQNKNNLTDSEERMCRELSQRIIWKLERNTEKSDCLSNHEATTEDDFPHSKLTNQIAENVFAHFVKKHSNDDASRSIETKIRNTKKQIDDCATAFIEAKSSILRSTIENKIAEHEKLLEYLEKQKTQLELEKQTTMTKQDALNIVGRFMQGADEIEVRKSLIDTMVKKVMCGDDGLVIYFNVVD